MPTSVPPSTPTQTQLPPAPSPTLIPADPEVLAGLRELAIPFDTAEPGSGFDDLEPFRAIVGDARIVALGEATHGTSEFFLMKHRLTELLVTELGFTIFAIEAPWPATKVINHYVHTGDATRSQLLDGLTFWPWKTQEVLDLIEWMRDYNTRPGVSPVSFQAFDMQLYADDPAMNQVLAFVQAVDPARAEQFAAYYDAVSIGGAQEALDDLLEHRDEYTNVPSPEPYEDIVQTARIIVQFEELKAVLEAAPPAQQATQFTVFADLRDRYMAENVTWLLDQADAEAKIILWAHNVHVAATELAGAGGTTQRGMGSHLRERYGDELIVVGFDFFSGTFIARGKDTVLPSAGGDWVHEIPLPSPESIEYTFAQLGLPRFMLNLRSVEAGSPAGDWLFEEHLMWSIGSGFNPTSLVGVRLLVRLPQPFDVLIYFHDTHASNPLF